MIFNMQTIDELLDKISLFENKYQISNNVSFNINESLNLILKMQEKYDSKSELFNYICQILNNLLTNPETNIDSMFDKALTFNYDKDSVELIETLINKYNFTSYGKHSLIKLNKLLVEHK
jgi:hypothetical protein